MPDLRRALARVLSEQAVSSHERELYMRLARALVYLGLWVMAYGVWWQLEGWWAW